MANVTLHDVGHAYDNKTPLESWPLKPLSVTFHAGRSYALVGPSGCGKTTMLNIISGLVAPRQGTVLFDDVDVTSVSTARRNVAQVFQFPAIYRSMNVYDNLAFPLVCRSWDSQRVDRRVREVAEILGIADKLGRAAARLGVDEKQLVSLGRGLVRDDVAVLLMDEPLTVIDPQLKAELRRRIKTANDTLGSTILYVTHDQYEAMTFAEELLVMREGEVVQQATPETLFERPANDYVGYFIGSPAMNFLTAEYDGQTARIGNAELRVEAGADTRGKVKVGIRPEHISVTGDDGGDETQTNRFQVLLRSVEDQGNNRILNCSLAGEALAVKVPRDVPIPDERELAVSVPVAKCLVYANGELVSGVR